MTKIPFPPSLIHSLKIAAVVGALLAVSLYRGDVARAEANFTGWGLPAVPTPTSTPSRVLHIGDGTVRVGAPVIIPVVLENAQGNEYTVSGSVNFDPALLSISSQIGPGNPDVLVGTFPGATNCTRNVRTDQLAQGRIGVSVSCSVGGPAIPAGNQTIYRLRFSATANGVPGTVTTLSIGSSPFFADVGGNAANSLPFTTISGKVTIQQAVLNCAVSPGCEGDINRSNAAVPGSGDGRLDGDDLIWYDRFANGANCPQVSPNEFQRIDTAPRASVGDGSLGLDRAQVERYIAGLDPLTAAGGPTSPATSVCSGMLTEEDEMLPADGDGNGVNRSLKIGPALTSKHSVVQVPIYAELVGDEAAVQFTIHFDPETLSVADIAGTEPNGDTAASSSLPEGARIIVNTSKLEDGDLGVLIYFNGSGTFAAVTAPAGTIELLNLRFSPIAQTNARGVTSLTFNDNVFPTKVSSSLGQPLPLTGGLKESVATFLNPVGREDGLATQ